MKKSKSIFSVSQVIGALMLVTIVAAVVAVVNTVPQPEQVEKERIKDSLRLVSAQRDSARMTRDSVRALRYDSARRAWAQQDSLRQVQKAERQQRYDSMKAYWAQQDSLRKLHKDSVKSRWDSIRARYPHKVDTVVELNRCDTTDLMKIRGIGRSTAVWIIRWRGRLGGFYSPEQLQGIVADSILVHFTANPEYIQRMKVNYTSQNALSKHPYLTYDQAEAIYSERRRKVRLKSMDELKTLGCLTENDRIRLKYYLSFEQ